MDLDLEDELAAAAGRADDATTGVKRARSGSDSEREDSGRRGGNGARGGEESEGEEGGSEDGEGGGRQGGTAPVKKRQVSAGRGRRAQEESEDEAVVSDGARQTPWSALAVAAGAHHGEHMTASMDI